MKKSLTSFCLGKKGLNKQVTGEKGDKFGRILLHALPDNLDINARSWPKS